MTYLRYTCLLTVYLPACFASVSYINYLLTGTYLHALIQLLTSLGVSSLHIHTMGATLPVNYNTQNQESTVFSSYTQVLLTED